MKEFYQALERICSNKYFVLLFLPIAIIFLLLYSYTTSPLFIHEGMDSAVFKTMGFAILQGKIPYVDIFDHKGPILYFINALGQFLIPGRLGIFCLQVVGLSTVLIFLFKTANLFVSKFTSFISVLITLFVYGGVIQEGNQCEEWMMIFFSISLYYVLKYFTQNSIEEHHWRYSLIYGLCFGITFFIRPNDAIAQIGGIMFGISIWLIYNKLYKNLLANILSFIVGISIVTLPIIVYFAYHNAIDDMLYGLIGFNAGYAGGIKSTLLSFIAKKKLVLGLLFITLWIITPSTKKEILYSLIPILCFQIILLGRNYFPHYYIVLIPIVLIYITFVILLRDRKLQIVAIAIFFLSTPFGDRQMIKTARKEAQYRLNMLFHQEKIKGFYAETNRLLSNIPIEERNKVWNHNLMWGNTPNFSCLLHNGIVQCNLITYGTNSFLESQDNILEYKPMWVIAENHDEDWRKNMFLIDSTLISAYEYVAKTDTTICHLELYHLKQ